MAKKKRQGHYCKICGETKANEKFSGKGHATHICKECVALPIERKNELQRINKVERISEKFRLTKEEWDLLEKYSKNNKYPELKEYAADILAHHRQMQEDRKPQIEEILYSDLEDELKEEIDEHLYIDFDFFIEEKGFVPEEKHLKKITKGIIDTYIRYSYLRIIPDDAWDERMKEVLKTVVANLEEDGIIPQSYESSLILFETERLCVSKFTRDDLDSLHRIMEKPEVMYAWEHGFTRNETRKWISHQLTRYKKDRYGYFAVFLKESGELIGQAGLMKSVIGGDEVTELGFIFDNEFWGKGYATESAKACLQYGFEKLGLNQIYCSIRPENTASIRVAENLEMTKTGEHTIIYNDIEMLHYIYVLEKNDFQLLLSSGA
ncbi:MAG: GNAT family N-acetyltransferase [Tannerellaceae bacterium]|jgi:RimJ/RimL family protein N-acetyltransferase|nr:GNAT family N-acetyltransferase [Tannerellaceae bacterium]